MLPDCGPEDEMRRTEELDAQQRWYEEQDYPEDDQFDSRDDEEPDDGLNQPAFGPRRW